MILIIYVYENVYYMVFTRHWAGKIWSSVCIQNIALHYQICLSIKSDEND